MKYTALAQEIARITDVDTRIQLIAALAFYIEQREKLSIVCGMTRKQKDGTLKLRDSLKMWIACGDLIRLKCNTFPDEYIVTKKLFFKKFHRQFDVKKVEEESAAELKNLLE
jgi:hypothetical protein